MNRSYYTYHPSYLSIPYSYRYGFNGQEREQQLNQSITSAEYWMYDGRLGRRWNVDPVFKEYESSYACFANNPISFIDPNGDDTLNVTGANNSKWTFIWGTGTNSTTYDLTKNPITNYDIGNKTVDFTGIVPDAIGLDINVGGQVFTFSGQGGVNVLFHLRGEKNILVPELHYYYGGGVNKPLNDPEIWKTEGNVTVAGFAAWAVEAKNENNSITTRPASDEWVANGFNWTGYFYSASFSVASFSASYFSSKNPATNLEAGMIYWRGISIGKQFVPSKGNNKVDYKTIFNNVLKNPSSTVTGGFSATYYKMVYGNGNDYYPNGEDVSGWHLFPAISPASYEKSCDCKCGCEF